MSTTYEADAMEEQQEREVNDGGQMLATLNRAEIDVQIATAKQWPRSLKAFKQQAMEMATLDEDTAASMFYVLPRAGKKIEGPSIRMAEVVGSCFGNLRYGARVVDVGEKFLTAQGACHDLEKNIAITYEVRRRITNKSGVRFNDDMIQMTGNAAQSIALREAIFRVVPRALYKNIVDEAKLCSVGKSVSMTEKRHKAFEWFAKAGAPQANLLEFLGRSGIDDVTIDDLITLRGMVTSIKDGELTIDEIFAKSETPTAKARKSDLNEKLQPKAVTPEAAPQANPEVHPPIEQRRLAEDRAAESPKPLDNAAYEAAKSAIAAAKTRPAVHKSLAEAQGKVSDENWANLMNFRDAKLEQLTAAGGDKQQTLA